MSSIIFTCALINSRKDFSPLEFQGSTLPFRAFPLAPIRTHLKDFVVRKLHV